MKIEGSRPIRAPREAVWSALNDTTVLKACIPGCQSFTATAPGLFHVVISYSLGLFSIGLKGDVRLTVFTPAQHFRIEGEGQGGISGTAKGRADIGLEDTEGGDTLLSYHLETSVGGKLASFGGRIIGGLGIKIADHFFARFEAAVRDRA